MFTIIRNMVRVPKEEALNNKYRNVTIVKCGTKYVYFDYGSYKTKFNISLT